MDINIFLCLASRYLLSVSTQLCWLNMRGKKEAFYPLVPMLLNARMKTEKIMSNGKLDLTIHWAQETQISSFILSRDGALPPSLTSTDWNVLFVGESLLFCVTENSSLKDCVGVLTFESWCLLHAVDFHQYISLSQAYIFSVPLSVNRLHALKRSGDQVHF